MTEPDRLDQIRAQYPDHEVVPAKRFAPPTREHIAGSARPEERAPALLLLEHGVNPFDVPGSDSGLEVFTPEGYLEVQGYDLTIGEQLAARRPYPDGLTWEDMRRALEGAS